MANEKYNPQHAGRAEFDKLFTDHQMTDAQINAKFTTINLNIADINTTLASRIYSVEHEVQTARGGYANLDERLDAMSAEGGGTTDYSELDNKPKIANVELDGNKTLDDFGIASTVALAAAETSIKSALARIIDSGAKNRCPIDAGACEAGSSWYQCAINLPVGEYVVSFGMLESDDTDATKCRGIFLAADSSNASSYFMFERGENVSAAVTLTKPAAFFRLNPSDTVAHSSGDIVSFENAMICTAEDWAVSDKYVAYCPTMQELYQMILNQNSPAVSTLSLAAAQSVAPNETEADVDA